MDDDGVDGKKRRVLVPRSSSSSKRMSPQMRRLLSLADKVLPVDRIYCVQWVCISPPGDPEPKYGCRGIYVPTNFTHRSTVPRYGRELDRAWAAYEREWRLKGKRDNRD